MTIPNSIALLQIISEKCNQNEIFFEKDSENLEAFRRVIHNSTNLSENPDFLNNSGIITQFQIWLLIGLSMYGGIFIPVIRSLYSNEKGLTITWDSGLSDSLTWGVWDSKTQVWAHYVLDRLSGKRVYKEGIDGQATLYLIKTLIESYAAILNACDDRVRSILSNKHSLFSHLANSPSHDLIFIIISSLPTEQMNALFIYIQQFFPDNIDVVSPSGNKINVSRLFQAQGVQVEYLMEKNRVYLDLYFSNKYPILKEITQSKTLAFLEKTLQNTASLNYTLTTLEALKNVQIETRLNLYRLVSAHLVTLM